LYRGRYIPVIVRFSEIPQLGDVAGLALDDEELNDLRKCRPGDCALKLSAQEILDVRAAASAAGGSWKPAVQLAFRKMLVMRARAYREHGFTGGAPYADRKPAISPAVEFDEIAESRLRASLRRSRAGPSAVVSGRGARERGVVPLLVDGNAGRRKADRQHHAYLHLPERAAGPGDDRGGRAPGVRQSLPDLGRCRSR
jgi:hypothetical protein